MSIRLCAPSSPRGWRAPVSFLHNGQQVSVADAASDASMVPMALAAGMLLDRNA
jgi:hypothetical protein